MLRRDLLRIGGLGAVGACVSGASLARERGVARLVAAQPTIEGAGVKLRRALGSQQLSVVDPFLLLDEIHSANPDDYLAGFPTHPHRGFETVTYMLHGSMEHRDSLGNHGLLGPGSAQWMTAGHGIVHSEMPSRAPDAGLLWGFQLWVNLPGARKLVRPRYQDIPAARIPEFAAGDAQVRLVTGSLRGHDGPVLGIDTAPLMLDVRVPPGGRFSEAVYGDGFAYVFEGAVQLGETRIKASELAVLGPGERVTVGSRAGGRLLLLAARPLGEPVARYGPFVMNTRAELQQAVDDYRAGTLDRLP